MILQWQLVVNREGVSTRYRLLSLSLVDYRAPFNLGLSLVIQTKAIIHLEVIFTFVVCQFFCNDF